jgi:hypothetical protein
MKKTKPLLSGILYGEIAFWCAVAGIIISTIGILIYSFCGLEFFNMDKLLNALWEGKNTEMIWREASGNSILGGYWFFKHLSTGDGIAMLGIAICAVSPVLGMFGAILGMVKGKEKPYIFLYFAVIILAILILSISGILSV